MIQLVKGINKNVVVTLTEFTTLSNAYYLFVFEHVTTKQVISFVLPMSADLSTHQWRYNEFLIAASHFTSAPVGKYQYNIYEQASSSNTNPSGLTMVEQGKMDLNNAAAFEFTQYSTATNYTQYGG
jgi:ABC-type molybdate transport system substrate-binding protein